MIKAVCCCLAIILANLVINIQAFPVRADDTLKHADLKKIYDLDKQNQIRVVINEVKFDREALLFMDLPPTIDSSFVATFELCNCFDPTPGTRDDQKDDVKKKIDHYLESIKDRPVIQHALRTTGSSLESLRATWFGHKRAFEHVFCGEAKRGKGIGGYHWWYKFYRDERAGLVNYLYSVEGKNDPGIATIKFTWDPDGPKPQFPKLKKEPKGGFLIGESPLALLALGHMALKFGLDTSSRGPDFTANINGKNYRWVIVVIDGNLHSMYPIANSR
jgi:hypothetical protein